MRIRQLERRIFLAQDVVIKEIRAFARDRGKIGGALSGEGYNGGYRDALSDVMAVINDIKPPMQRARWWQEHGGE